MTTPTPKCASTSPGEGARQAEVLEGPWSLVGRGCLTWLSPSCLSPPQSCVSYVPEPENSALLRCALGIFRKFSRYPEALRLALMLNDVELVEDIFTSCKDV